MLELFFFFFINNIFVILVDMFFNRQSEFLYGYQLCSSHRLVHIELEIKDTTDTARSASNLDLHLKIDSNGQLRTKQQKR